MKTEAHGRRKGVEGGREKERVGKTEGERYEEQVLCPGTILHGDREVGHC